MFLSRERAYLRLHPATTEGERARVKVVGLDDCGRRRLWAVTVLLSWDAARVAWTPWDSASTRDVAAELWSVVETAANRDRMGVTGGGGSGEFRLREDRLEGSVGRSDASHTARCLRSEH